MEVEPRGDGRLVHPEEATAPLSGEEGVGDTSWKAADEEGVAIPNGTPVEDGSGEAACGEEEEVVPHLVLPEGTEGDEMVGVERVDEREGEGGGGGGEGGEGGSEEEEKIHGRGEGDDQVCEGVEAEPTCRPLLSRRERRGGGGEPRGEEVERVEEEEGDEVRGEEDGKRTKRGGSDHLFLLVIFSLSCQGKEKKRKTN